MEKKIKTFFTVIILIIIVFLVRNKLASFYNNQGVLFHEKGYHEDAVRCFKRALMFNSNVDSIHFNLANAYMDLQERDLALDEYKKVIELDKKGIKGCRAVVALYLEKQMFEDALSLANECISRTNSSQMSKELKDKVVWEYMAQCLSKGVDEYLTGNKEKAYSLINKAIKLRYDFAYAHYTIGYFYFSDNLLNAALTELEETISIDYGFWPAHKLAGDIYFSKENYALAVEKYKLALQFNNNASEIYNDLGLALMQMEDYAQAIVYLKKALNFDQGNIEIIYSLASVYRDNNMLNEALAEYKKVVEMRPDYPNVYNDIGSIYKKQGRIDEAETQFYKEIENSRQKIIVNNDDPVSLNNLANSYNELGEFQKAENIINKVISLNPDYRQAYLTLASIQEASGNHKKALKSLEKAGFLSKETNFIERAKVKSKELLSGITDKKNTLDNDKVYLKNGRKLEGVIKEDNSRNLILELQSGKSSGTVILSNSDIEKVEKGIKSK